MIFFSIPKVPLIIVTPPTPPPPLLSTTIQLPATFNNGIDQTNITNNISQMISTINIQNTKFL